MITARAIAARLRAEGYSLELVKGSGYFYFVWDDGEKYESESVYVNSLNHLDLAEWMRLGREFGNRMKGTTE